MHIAYQLWNHPIKLAHVELQLRAWKTSRIPCCCRRRRHCRLLIFTITFRGAARSKSLSDGDDDERRPTDDGTVSSVYNNRPTGEAELSLRLHRTVRYNVELELKWFFFVIKETLWIRRVDSGADRLNLLSYEKQHNIR